MSHSFYRGLWIEALCLVQSFISIKVHYVRPACGCESICKGILWGKLQSMAIEWESQSLVQKTGSPSLTSSRSSAVIVLLSTRFARSLDLVILLYSVISLWNNTFKSELWIGSWTGADGIWLLFFCWENLWKNQEESLIRIWKHNQISQNIYNKYFQIFKRVECF